MKRKLTAILLLLCLSLCAFFGCSHETKVLSGIAADTSALPQNQRVGEATLDGLVLVLTFEDGSTSRLTLGNQDFSQQSLDLLKVPGEQTFTVHYLGFTTSFTLTILPEEERGPEPIIGVTFPSAEFVYDGQPHSVFVIGAPEDAFVDYYNNGKTEPGVYEVTAVVARPGYYEPLTLTATLTILPNS